MISIELLLLQAAHHIIAARYAAELFGSISKIEARAVYSSDFYLKKQYAHQDGILYIFITQSGETTDTNSALDKAKEFGVKTLCITNKENSTIWNASDYKVACLAGEEKSIAATKSFISQLLCSTLLALKFAQDKGIDIYDYVLDLKTVPAYINSTYELQPKNQKPCKIFSKIQKYNYDCRRSFLCTGKRSFA